MKHIIFFLFISTTVFAQTPRLKFRQIQKDTTQGSIAISNPADSQLVFSRDFYISYGVDTVLILYGDTIGVGGTLDAEQVQDIVGAMVNAGLGLDVTYNDVDGELLLESLSIEDSVKNETALTILKGTPLYAVTTVGNYWSVAPADATDPAKMPVVAIAGEDLIAGATGVGLILGHIKGVNVPTTWSAGDEVWVGANGTFINHEPATEDTLIQRLGSIIKTGTNGSGIISIGDVNKNLNDGNIFIGDATGKVTTTQYIVDSTRLNTTGDTAFYYQNGLLIGSQEIAGGGGTSYNNISETADTVFITGDLNVDANTLYVDATTNKVGIGTSSPQGFFSVEKEFPSSSTLGFTVSDPTSDGIFQFKTGSSTFFQPRLEGFAGADAVSGSFKVPLGLNFIGAIDTSLDVTNNNVAVLSFQTREYDNFPSGGGKIENARIFNVVNWDEEYLSILANGNVGIGTSSPSAKLTVEGKTLIRPESTTAADIEFAVEERVYQNGSTIGMIEKTSDNGFTFIVDAEKSGIFLDNDGAKSTISDVGSGNDYVFINYWDLNTNGLENDLSFDNYNGDIIFSSNATASKIGIGTKTPGSKLHVYSATANDVLLVQDNSGTCEAQPTTTGLTWSCSSDARLKTNIRDAESVLDYINGIRIREYNVINTYENAIGVVAQEMLENYPELVTMGEDGYYRVSSLGSWTIVKAIQEQQAIIETQEQKITDLETIIQSLITRIENLENK